MVHQPVSRGLAVFADAWLSDWLAEISADLRETVAHLEVVLHDDALYNSTKTLCIQMAVASVITVLKMNANFVSRRLFDTNETEQILIVYLFFNTWH